MKLIPTKTLDIRNGLAYNRVQALYEGGARMLISTKGRYSLKAAAYLAKIWREGRAVTVGVIAGETGAPQNYLETLLRDLKNGGLVISERGLKGGYRLAKEPGEITVGAVLRATEGDLAPAPCLSQNDAGNCGKCGECETKETWERIFEGFNEVLDGITLGDL